MTSAVTKFLCGAQPSRLITHLIGKHLHFSSQLRRIMLKVSFITAHIYEVRLKQINKKENKAEEYLRLDLVLFFINFRLTG